MFRFGDLAQLSDAALAAVFAPLPVDLVGLALAGAEGCFAPDAARGAREVPVRAIRTTTISILALGLLAGSAVGVTAQDEEADAGAVSFTGAATPVDFFDGADGANRFGSGVGLIVVDA